MQDWITETFGQLGYLGLAAAMLLENVFPPIPSEAVLPAAGIAARQGVLSLIGAILAATAGSLLGVIPWYFIGRWVGTERLARWADRRGRWLGISSNDVRRADAWFDRRGHLAILFGRMVPGLRTLISVPAGVSGMGFGRFLIYSALGTLGWSTLLVLLGWWLGKNSNRLTTGLGWIGVAVTVGLFGWLAWRFLRARKTQAAA